MDPLTMRALIQRVSTAKVEINNKSVGEIDSGFLVLLGIEPADAQSDIDWLVRKITGLRVFSDDEGKMNLSLTESGGSALVVSQFTLHASCKKGNRPSFTRAAHPDQAAPLYQAFCDSLAIGIGKPVAKGQFGADMQVSLTNDGPVTIMLDSKQTDY